MPTGRDPLHWRHVLTYGAIASALPLLLFQATYWSGALLSYRFGLISFLLQIFAVIFGLIVLGIGLVRLRGKHLQGAASFLDIAVHAILMALVAGGLKVGHDLAFFGAVAPGFQAKATHAMAEGAERAAETAPSDSLRTAFRERAAHFRQQKEQALQQSFDPSEVLYNNLILYLVGGLLFGIVMGLMLRTD